MSEELLFECSQSLSFSIFRPANITFDLKSGECNLTDYITRYVKTCISLNACIDDDSSTVNFTPVAFISNIIVEKAFKMDEIEGKIFNISNNKSPSYTFLGECLKERFGLEVVPYMEFREKILSFENKESLALYGLIPLFADKDVWIMDDTDFGKFLCLSVLSFHFISR